MLIKKKWQDLVKEKTCQFSIKVIYHRDFLSIYVLLILLLFHFRSGKRKSGRAGSGGSTVSARPREGGSLPPTKFENVVCLGATSSVAATQHLPWESDSKVRVVDIDYKCIRHDQY